MRDVELFKYCEGRFFLHFVTRAAHVLIDAGGCSTFNVQRSSPDVLCPYLKSAGHSARCTASGTLAQETFYPMRR
jgi:hypothetical protein